MSEFPDVLVRGQAWISVIRSGRGWETMDVIFRLEMKFQGHGNIPGRVQQGAVIL